MPFAPRTLCLGVLSTAWFLAACAETSASSPAPPSSSGAGGSAGAAIAGGGEAGSPPAEATGGKAGSSVAGAAGVGGAGAAPAPPACPPAPDVKPGASATCVRDVRGTLRDESGAPMRKRTVTLCGVVCFGGSTDENGTFVIAVDASLPSDGYAVLAHGRPDLASVIVRLPTPLAEHVVVDAPITMAALPVAEVALPDDGAPAQTVTVGAISLLVPAGTTWELDPEDAVDEGAARPLAYARVAGDHAPAFAAGSPLVFVLGPFDARPSTPVGVEIALDETAATSFPAGAAVELITLDTAVYVSGHTGGQARLLARGHVSADGKRVTTDADEGIDALGWLALRLAP